MSKREKIETLLAELRAMAANVDADRLQKYLRDEVNQSVRKRPERKPGRLFLYQKRF